MNEHLLPGLQVRFFDQRLPSGQADQRYRSCLFHVQPVRLLRDVILVDGDQLGKAPILSLSGFA